LILFHPVVTKETAVCRAFSFRRRLRAPAGPRQRQPTRPYGPLVNGRGRGRQVCLHAGRRMATVRACAGGRMFRRHSCNWLFVIGYLSLKSGLTLHITNKKSSITNGPRFPGGHRSWVTPVPIPNTEVKPTTADGTAWVTVWESRSLPGLFSRARCHKHRALFFCTPGRGFL
jgi:hypothetical protein